MRYDDENRRKTTETSAKRHVRRILLRKEYEEVLLFVELIAFMPFLEEVFQLLEVP